MRWMLIMAAFLAAAFVTTCGADDKSDNRTYWVYEGGWFAKDKDGSWYEYNEPTFRALGKPGKFGEAKRTQQFLDLYDDSRRLYVRLWDKYAEKLSPKGDWVKTYDGKWKTPE